MLLRNLRVEKQTNVRHVQRENTIELENGSAGLTSNIPIGSNERNCHNFVLESVSINNDTLHDGCSSKMSKPITNRSEMQLITEIYTADQTKYSDHLLPTSYVAAKLNSISSEIGRAHV